MKKADCELKFPLYEHPCSNVLWMRDNESQPFHRNPGGNNECPLTITKEELDEINTKTRSSGQKLQECQNQVGYKFPDERNKFGW